MNQNSVGKQGNKTGFMKKKMRGMGKRANMGHILYISDGEINWKKKIRVFPFLHKREKEKEQKKATPECYTGTRRSGDTSSHVSSKKKEETSLREGTLQRTKC